MSKRKPNIIYWDIETLPFEGYFWNSFQGVINQTVKQVGTIVTLAYKLNNKPTVVLTVDPKNVRDDKEIIKQFNKVLESADYLVAHYGDKFDWKYYKWRCLANGLNPPPPVKTIDTYKMAKNNFLNNVSNRLNHIAKELGLGGKLSTDWSLWEGCLKGDKKALKYMAKYNKQDVDLLQKVFLKLLPHCPTKFNKTLFSSCNSCSGCGSINLESRGYAITLTKKYNRLQCKDCGKWNQGDLV